MAHDSQTPMTGRTVVVTGGTSGIGRATARRLAQLGATVALAGRDPVRTHDTAAEISAATGADVRPFTADLSSQADVHHLAAELLGALPRIDVLVKNAGGYWNSRHVTADGLERTFAVNHLAPFLLTNLLLTRLEESDDGRVVTVSSNAQALGRIDFDDLQGERRYSGARAYNQSKLATVLFTYELARRLTGTSVTANALHPGVVRTSFGAQDPGRAQRLFVPVARLFMQSPTEGADTSVLLASSPHVRGAHGRYFSNGTEKRTAARTYDRELAVRLWRASEVLVGHA